MKPFMVLATEEPTSLTTYLQSVAVIVVSLAATVAALGVLVKSKLVGRPIRWILNQLISEPVAQGFSRAVQVVMSEQINEIHEQITVNGGKKGTLKDRVEEMRADISGMRISVEVLDEKVSQLLQHDNERDVKGKRYKETPSSD